MCSDRQQPQINNSKKVARFHTQSKIYELRRSLFTVFIRQSECFVSKCDYHTNYMRLNWVEEGILSILMPYIHIYSTRMRVRQSNLNGKLNALSIQDSFSNFFLSIFLSLLIVRTTTSWFDEVYTIIFCRCYSCRRRWLLFVISYK